MKKNQNYINEDPVKLLLSICSNKGGSKNSHLEKIFSSSRKLFRSTKGIKSLEKSILLHILEKDDLSVDEIEVWQKIINWGLAKHPEINNNNIEDWSSQNFADLGKTLKELISLIRFKDITSQDFRYKLVPYQRLFPKVLWETLLDYYLVGDDRSYSNLLPQRKLINQKLILLFASWIDRKKPPYDSSEEVKYKFKLLYHSSRDGILNNNCDKISKTLYSC